jgi:peroxiredoxin-like protein
MSATLNFEVNLQWNNDRKGTLSSPVLPGRIEVATPPDFPKGMAGIWSPEHLFVAAVNSCFMTTFLSIAENSKMEFISFDCNAVGIVDKVEGKYRVTEITLKPTIIIPSSLPEDKAKRIVEMTEKACLISNSINSKINLEPIITSNE